MPLVGFSVFKDKIKDGTKRQTIRKPRKSLIEVGDTLYLYWHLRQKDCELLAKVTCKDVRRVRYSDFAFDDELAKRDGFRDSAEMREWFSKTHEPKPNDFFDIISW